MAYGAIHHNRPGRPKKAAPPRRRASRPKGVPTVIYLRPVERRRLEEDAQRAGMSPSMWVRFKLWGLKPIPDTAYDTGGRARPSDLPSEAER